MRKITNALFAGLLGGLLLMGTAYAHAAYLRSEPGAGAVVAVPPVRVDIWFEQELFRRQGENTISVTGPDARHVSTGETSIDDDDRTHIWVNLLPGLPAGKYLVEWKNVSLEDGHPTTGSFTFTIDPQSQTASTPMLAPSSPTPKTVITSTISPQPVPSSDAPAASSATPSPCAAGMLPALGLFAFVLGRRFYNK
jgi:copper resistance protein C